ncbi:MAG: flagellar hook-associated protein FlgK [Alphaproteobacteria bacterium]|nr:flagellar hook-associated protein FlgK [Alphaproteobacteria bacterium]
MSGSLSVALSSALSGLQVNQTALGITSNNIANANTDGYSRKVADLRTVIIDGEAAGVEIAGVNRKVSEFLVRDLREQISLLGNVAVLDRYYSNIQDMFGPPGSSASIGATITELGNRLQALGVDPESPNAQQDVLNAMMAVTRQLNQMAATVQDIRMEANREISALVLRTNTLIEGIAELNGEIGRATALNQPTGDMEDQRDRAVAELSEIMDISYFTRDSGQMVIMAGNGRTLIDTTEATVAYTAASNMSASVTYPGNGISPITVNGVDITGDIQSGQLKALIDMRDSVLPGLGDQLDVLAGVLRDELNALHNDGSAVPPANTLNGTRIFANPGTDTVSLSGAMRIAVVDGSGNVVGTPIDFNLDDLATVVGGPPTVDQIRDAINGVYSGASPAIPGLAGATASVNAAGQLVIAANTTANGIAINEGTALEATTGFGFSHYFGLNNLFTGSTIGGLASNISVRAEIIADPQLIVRGELAEGTLANGDPGVTIGDNSVVQRMFRKFEQQLTFAQAGTIPQSTSSLAGYGATILSTNANLAAAAADEHNFRNVIYEDIRQKTTSISGVNIDEELGNLILFQNAYAANARMVNVLSEVLEILSDLV